MSNLIGAVELERRQRRQEVGHLLVEQRVQGRDAGAGGAAKPQGQRDVAAVEGVSEGRVREALDQVCCAGLCDQRVGVIGAVGCCIQAQAAGVRVRQGGACEPRGWVAEHAV